MFIKPSEILSENFEKLATIAREEGAPVFITKNGEADTVLLSVRYFEEHFERYSVSTKGHTRPENQRNDTITKEEGISMEHTLGKELSKMYENAPRGDQVAFIHLFGIRFAKEITQKRLNKKEILIAAGLPESYQTEIAKGIKLAKYVTINSDVIF